MARYFMFFMALAASVLSVRAGAQTAIAGAENRRIEALQQTIASAIIRRDISVLDRLYADDYEYVDTAGVVYTKAQVLARYRTPTIENTSLTYDSLRVRIYGHVAVV